MRWHVDRGVLHVAGRTAGLRFPVAEVLDLDSGLVVRVDVPPGEHLNRNVYFVDPDGSIAWQIEESPHGTQTDRPFMKIWREPGGEIRAGNWNGVDYRVDLHSGAIEPAAFPK